MITYHLSFHSGCHDCPTGRILERRSVGQGGFEEIAKYLAKWERVEEREQEGQAGLYSVFVC